jgi:hypothetical protein
LGAGLLGVFPSEMQGLARGPFLPPTDFTEEARRETGQLARSVKGLHFRMFLIAKSRSRKNVFFREFAASVAENYDLKKSYI